MNMESASFDDKEKRVKEPGHLLPRRAFLKGLLAFGAAKLSEQSVHTEEQKNLSIEEISQIALKIGFDAKVEVASSNGTYLIHVSQSHLFEGLTDEEKKGVIVSQKNIENFLLALRDSGIRNVYSEGVVPESLDLMNEIKKIVDSRDLPAGVKAREKLDELYEEGKKYITSNLAGGKESAYILLRYLLQQKTGKMKVTVKDSKDEEIYLAGAAEKLSLDGKINLLPAEKEKSSKGERGLIGEINAMTKELEDPNISNEKWSDIMAKIKAKKEMLQEISEDREDVAIEIISHGKGSYRVLIYGSDHRFKENIDSYNRKNKGKEIGLITLSPK